MQVRMFRPPSRILLLPVGLAFVAMLILATPATAADNDTEGWYVALDVALTQPNSLDHHYADQVTFPAAPPPVNVSERLVLENDSDPTFRFAVGHSWGEKGNLEISYWGFDNDDEESGFLAGIVYPQIIGFGFQFYGQYLYDPDFRTTASVDATIIDIDYTREAEVSKNFTLEWLAGIRIAQYEEQQSFWADDGFVIFTQDKQFESDALGLRVGGTGKFAITDVASLESGLAFSFLQADTEGSGTISDIAGAPLESFLASDDNIKGEIRDFWLEFVWSTKRLDWFLGYWVSNWDGLVIDPVTTALGTNYGGTSQRDRDEISFNSVYAGARWKIGGK